jgi:hypothetical protein
MHQHVSGLFMSEEGADVTIRAQAFTACFVSFTGACLPPGMPSPHGSTRASSIDDGVEARVFSLLLAVIYILIYSDSVPEIDGDGDGSWRRMDTICRG